MNKTTHYGYDYIVLDTQTQDDGTTDVAVYAFTNEQTATDFAEGLSLKRCKAIAEGGYYNPRIDREDEGKYIVVVDEGTCTVFNEYEIRKIPRRNTSRAVDVESGEIEEFEDRGSSEDVIQEICDIATDVAKTNDKKVEEIVSVVKGSL